MILNMVCYNSAGGAAIPYFTYSGRCMLKNDGNGNWRIGFITSGVFIPSTDMEIDLFLCGAGAGGQSGKSTSKENTYGKGGNDGGKGAKRTSYGGKYAGHGGGGGYTVTHKKITLIKNVEYIVVIGAGGAKDSAGGQSSFGTYIALGGDGAVATSNTSVNGGSNGSPGQGTTTREFEEETGELYSGAGGAGGTYDSGEYPGGAGGAGGYTDGTKGGGTYGDPTTTSHRSGGHGDVSETWGLGGGTGGGTAGSASGGGGGGGIGAGGGGGANGGAAGGAGAQGIVIIRNARVTA